MITACDGALATVRKMDISIGRRGQFDLDREEHAFVASYTFRMIQKKVVLVIPSVRVLIEPEWNLLLV